MNRKVAREQAFTLLFESVARPDATPEEIFETAVVERELETDDFVKEIFFGVNSNLTEIENALESCLVVWKKNRISVTSSAILRLGAFELLYKNDIPALVTINECIELSKKFDDEKTYSFVNGVLNALAEKCGKKNAK